MAPVDGDIIRITTQATWTDGNTADNVYFFRYELGDDAATYEEMKDAMSGFLTLNVRPITTSALTYSKVKIENLTNGLDLEEYAISVAGTATGDYLPAFNAFAFRYYRGSKITRNGRKSFAGVPESLVASGVPTAAALTALGTVAAALLAGLQQTVGGVTDWTLVPIIVGRTLVGGSYVVDLTKINEVVDVRFERLSTQNTRKRYN